MRNQVWIGLVVLAACGGTDATVSGVFPAEGFTGRSLRVEISGDATEWSGAPGVNFGDGVTVSNVAVASPTTLFADITIADSAALGPRDVTVTADGTFTLKQAFVLESPIEVQWQGEAAQGSIPYFSIINHDFDAPFDLTQDANQEYQNLVITAPQGVTLNIQSATAYGVTGFAFIDTDAMPGPLTIASGSGEKVTKSNLGANLEIKPRTAMMLTDGMAASGMLPNTGDSQLYAISAAAAPTLLRASVSTSSSAGAPVTTILPASGKWADAVGGSLAVANDAGMYYVVVFDNGTAGGYSYSLTGRAQMLTATAEGNDANNGATAGALTATLPFQQTGGTLSSSTDKDMIKVVLTSSARLHVIANGPADATDTALDITSSNGTTSVISGPQDDDFLCGFLGQCGEEVVTPSLAAGTYYVVVSAGATFASADSDYQTLIYIE